MTQARKWLLIGGFAVLLGGVIGLGWWLGHRSVTPASPEVGGFHREAFAWIPKDAVVIGTADLGSSLDELIERNLGLFPVTTDPETIRVALRETSKAHFGIDLLATRRAVVWGLASGAVGVLLEGDFGGPIKGSSKGTAGGVDVVSLGDSVHAAVTKPGLLVGTEEGVRLGAEIIAGNGPSVAQDETARKAHSEALEAIEDGSVVVSGRLDGLPPQVRGLRSAGLVFRGDGSMAGAVAGEEATLAMGFKAFETARTDAKAALDEQLAQAKAEAASEPQSDAAWTVLGLTFLVSKYDDLSALIMIEQNGQTLTFRGSGGSAGGFVAILGLGAAVAVPTFTKYLRRAKALEAVHQIELHKDNEIE